MQWSTNSHVSLFSIIISHKLIQIIHVLIWQPTPRCYCWTSPHWRLVFAARHHPASPPDPSAGGDLEEGRWSWREKREIVASNWFEKMNKRYKRQYINHDGLWGYDDGNITYKSDIINNQYHVTLHLIKQTTSFYRSSCLAVEMVTYMNHIPQQ